MMHVAEERTGDLLDRLHGHDTLTTSLTARVRRSDTEVRADSSALGIEAGVPDAGDDQWVLAALAVFLDEWSYALCATARS